MVQVIKGSARGTLAHGRRPDLPRTCNAIAQHRLELELAINQLTTTHKGPAIHSSEKKKGASNLSASMVCTSRPRLWDSVPN